MTRSSNPWADPPKPPKTVRVSKTPVQATVVPKTTVDSLPKSVALKPWKEEQRGLISGYAYSTSDKQSGRWHIVHSPSGQLVGQVVRDTNSKPNMVIYRVEGSSRPHMSYLTLHSAAISTALAHRDDYNTQADVSDPLLGLSDMLAHIGSKIKQARAHGAYSDDHQQSALNALSLHHKNITDIFNLHFKDERD